MMTSLVYKQKFWMHPYQNMNKLLRTIGIPENRRNLARVMCPTHKFKREDNRNFTFSNISITLPLMQGKYLNGHQVMWFAKYIREINDVIKLLLFTDPREVFHPTENHKWNLHPFYRDLNWNNEYGLRVNIFLNKSKFFWI